MATKQMSKKARKKRRIMLFIIEIVVLLLLLLALFVIMKLNKITTNEIKKEDLKVNEDISKDVLDNMEEYTTIVLFGLDNRSNGTFESGNSDVMIIASINNETKEIKMSSIYRDTYLRIDDETYKKCNAAFNRGGPKQAINMLNTNLDMNISEYVAFDFNAVAEVVDKLDGVEIELSQQEATDIRGYIDEVAELTGKKASYPSAGVQTLNGVQATSYARIRTTAGSDFRRTERQRLVIEKVFEKAQKADVLTLNNIIDTVFEEIATSLSTSDLLLLAKDAFSYSLGENTGWPFEKESFIFKGQSEVFAADLVSNVEELHKFLFQGENYTPSSTVQEISDHIVNETGVQRIEPTPAEGE